MALLSAADQQTLRESLGAMVEPVTILFFTQVIDCDRVTRPGDPA